MESGDARVVTTSLAPTPQAKAAMELGFAQTLENSRKTKQALEAYRRIVQEYPESSQAKIAAERLGALGSR
jgi:TolA-binding protein